MEFQYFDLPSDGENDLLHVSIRKLSKVHETSYVMCDTLIFFNKYLLSACCVSSPTLDAGNTSPKKMTRDFCSHRACILAGKERQ